MTRLAQSDLRKLDTHVRAELEFHLKVGHFLLTWLLPCQLTWELDLANWVPCHATMMMIAEVAWECGSCVALHALDASCVAVFVAGGVQRESKP